MPGDLSHAHWPKVSGSEGENRPRKARSRANFRKQQRLGLGIKNVVEKHRLVAHAANTEARSYVQDAER